MIPFKPKHTGESSADSGRDLRIPLNPLLTLRAVVLGVRKKIRQGAAGRFRRSAFAFAWIFRGSRFRMFAVLCTQDLFEPRSFEYAYKVIVTNKKESARTVLLFHNGRGSQEKIFGESKQHVAVDLIPTRTKNGNIMFTLAGMLGHNMAREFQMATRSAERPTLALLRSVRADGTSWI